MEVSLDNLYVDTEAYRGLNREFTTLPNFLLVLKVLLICFFSDFNPSKRIFRTSLRKHPFLLEEKRMFSQANVGPPFSTDLILAKSESLQTMIGSLTFLLKQWKKFSSAQSKNKITCAKAEAFELSRSVLVCSSLLLFSQEIIVSKRI